MNEAIFILLAYFAVTMLLGVLAARGTIVLFSRLFPRRGTLTK